MHLWALDARRDVVNNGMTLQLLNGVPRQVTVFATPFAFYEVLNQNWGLFAQDQWTDPAADAEPRRAVRLPQRQRAGADARPGAAGADAQHLVRRGDATCRTGRTCRRGSASPTICSATARPRSRFSIGKYLEAPNPTTFTRIANPAGAIVQSATRTWSDATATSSRRRASSAPINADQLRHHRRQHALRDGRADDRGYNWEIGGAGAARDRAARVGERRLLPALVRQPARHRQHCGRRRPTTARTASRRRRRAAAWRRRLHRLRPVRRQPAGAARTTSSGWRRTSATRASIYNGVDVTVNVRLPQRHRRLGRRQHRPHGNQLLLRGRLAAGHRAAAGAGRDERSRPAVLRRQPPFQPTSSCSASTRCRGGACSSRRRSRACRVRRSSRRAPTPTPRSRRRSAATSRTGVDGTAAVQLIAPGTMYDERLYQLDFRVSKIFSLGAGARLQANRRSLQRRQRQLDPAINTTYGSNWLRPTHILQGRLVKFGVQLDF